MTKEILIPFGTTVKIHGVLHQNNKSDTLVLLCHGFGDSKDTHGIKRLAELIEPSVNIFRFTFTDSETNIKIEAENIHAIVSYFKTKYMHIIVMGISLGGLSSLLGTISGKNIDKLILLNPFVYLHMWVTWKYRKTLLLSILLAPILKRLRDTLIFYRTNLKPQDLLIPTLLIVSIHDEIVSPSHGKTLFGQIGALDKKLILDDEIDHGLSKEEYLKKVAGYIINWTSK